MKSVIIYTQNDCPPCTFIKSYLTDKGVAFEEKNVANAQYRNEMMEYDAFATPLYSLMMNQCIKLIWKKLIVH